MLKSKPILLVHAVAGAVLPLSTQAASIGDLAAVWPAGGIQTVDALSVTDGGRGVNNTRVERQSFSVSETTLVESVYLSTQSYGNDSFELRFYQVSDVTSTAALTNETTQVGGTITVDAFGSTRTGDGNLKIDLGAGEQFALPALAAPAGYVIRITGGSSATAFSLSHSNTGADLYAGGRYRRDDGDTTSTRDFGIAITGAVVVDDSDGDGLNDFWEDEHFGNPSDGIIQPEDLVTARGSEAQNPSFGADWDNDNDGADNEEEETEGTDPNVADTDADGINDGDEDLHGTDPLDPDSDGDGISDGEEVTAGVDGFVTNPLLADTDEDTLLDKWEIDNSLDPTDDGTTDPDNGAAGDPDEETLSNADEQLYQTDPRDPDTDDDTLSDYDELYTYFTNPLVADSDLDGISDGEEIVEGADGYVTNPLFPDTDGDGVPDGVEVANGTDPTEYFDTPAAISASIDSLNAPWPGSGVRTVDALSNSPATNGVHSTRVVRQSFSVTETSPVEAITLSAIGYNDLAFRIQFYQVSDVNNPAALLEQSTMVGSTITVAPVGSTASGARNLKVLLDPADVFSLPALAAPAGYVMAVFPVDTGDSTTVFGWAHSNTGTDLYPGGRYRPHDGATNNTRDFGLAVGENDDTDLDGLSDYWEDLHFGDVSGTIELEDLSGARGLESQDPSLGADWDNDNDGADNEEEETEGTDPNVADTDADGLNDGDENPHGTSPLDPDCDDDGILDGEEVVAGTDGFVTDPLNEDTDGDYLLDKWEIDNGLDPTDDGSLVFENGDFGDPDEDGLDNYGEQDFGTDPQDPDTDDDTLTDYDEIYIHSTDPLVADTDGDGISDGEEVSAGADGYVTDPLLTDTDGDGASDAYEISVGTDPTDEFDTPEPLHASLVSFSAPWPGGGVQTIDALGNSPAGRGINGARVNRQSFSVPEATLVKSIYLSAMDYGNRAFTIGFFRVSAVNDTAVLANEALQVGKTIIVDAHGSTSTGSGNLRIDLAPGDEFTLPAVAEPGGYVIRIAPVDSEDTTVIFQWVHSNSGVDLYSGGRYRRDDGNTTNTRDFGVAITDGTSSPDSDSDGMDDAWESTYGLLVGIDDSAEDLDNDGTDNLTEYRLGLIPNDGSSRFAVVSTDTTPGDGFTVGWQGVEGETFAVLRSIDGMISWQNVSTQPGTAGAMSYTDLSAPAGRAFYRVALLPAVSP